MTKHYKLIGSAGTRVTNPPHLDAEDLIGYADGFALIMGWGTVYTVDQALEVLDRAGVAVEALVDEKDTDGQG